MLPNLKFLVCGILFCLVLFVVAGAGVMLPDARTRVGEMPEIGRPMMQRSMAAAQTQIYVVTAARRSDEAERVREPASDAASQPPEPDAADPGTANPDAPRADVMAEAAGEAAAPAGPAPAQVPDHAPTVQQAPLREAGAADTPPPAGETGGVAEAVPSQVATLAPPAGEVGEAIRPFTNVPVPAPRPLFFQSQRRHNRLLHRRHRIEQHDAAAPAGQGAADPAGSPP